MTATIPEAAYSLFDEPVYAHVTTLMPDGSPQMSIVWVDRDGDTVVLNTVHGRVKPRNIERDPRVAVALVDPTNPWRYVEVRGRAELVDEGATEHIHKLSNKYVGRDYDLPEGQQRVIVRVRPDYVRYYGERS